MPLSHEYAAATQDLGTSAPDSETTRPVRLALAHEIARVASSRSLTQCQTAELLGTTQPKVSALFAGKVDGFSLDRLVRFLNALGEDVHIVVLPRSAETAVAATHVMSAARFLPSATGWSYA
jgi:predicted XRE-type DNA-binding protein